MIRLLVLYLQPRDPEAFDHYYESIHIPLAKKMQGLSHWTIGKVTKVDSADRQQVHQAIHSNVG